MQLCSAEQVGLVASLSCSSSLQCLTDWSWLSCSQTGNSTVTRSQSVLPGWQEAWSCWGTRGPSPAAYTRGPSRGLLTEHGAPHSVRGCGSQTHAASYVLLLIDISSHSINSSLFTHSRFNLI